jgi:hypothetical protein
VGSAPGREGAWASDQGSPSPASLSPPGACPPRPPACLPQGFEKTGLGERVANIFVAGLGKSSLGLSLGLTAAEALVAPAMPSTTARAGGIFMPVITSLSAAAGSMPGERAGSATPSSVPPCLSSGRCQPCACSHRSNAQQPW